MSKYANEKINSISPYVPGEQPKEREFIKLNTNENPYYTSDKAVERITAEVVKKLNRYSDPENRLLCSAIADYYSVSDKNVLVTNGSDEALAFAFFAYGGEGVCYPDVTYGFYDVIARLYDCKVEHVALNDDFTISVKDYLEKKKTVVIANPNAQTGIELPLADIEQILKNNRENVVIIDQAYADFGENNAIELINKYDNLLVINTFSKSRSLAGARVGYAIASEGIIEDLKKVKNSFHPYNVNSLSAILAAQAIGDDEYFKQSVERIKLSRSKLIADLQKLEFTVLPSSANFVLAKSKCVKGEDLYLKLKDKGVLVRHFNEKRIDDYVRITVGTDGEMQALTAVIKEILKGA